MFMSCLIWLSKFRNPENDLQLQDFFQLRCHESSLVQMHHAFTPNVGAFASAVGVKGVLGSGDSPPDRPLKARKKSTFLVGNTFWGGLKRRAVAVFDGFVHGFLVTSQDVTQLAAH